MGNCFACLKSASNRDDPNSHENVMTGNISGGKSSSGTGSDNHHRSLTAGGDNLISGGNHFTSGGTSGTGGGGGGGVGTDGTMHHRLGRIGEFGDRSETDQLLGHNQLKFTNIGGIGCNVTGGVNSSDVHKSNMKKSTLHSTNSGGGGGGGSCGGGGGGIGATGFNDNSSSSANKEHHISDNTLNALFEEYKDQHQDDAILSEGIVRLCNDLGYKPDDFAILVLAWRLNASQMCRFTKSEFIQGLQSMQADTIGQIRIRLEETILKLKSDSDLFKQLYRFTFIFGLEPGFRTVSLDMAMSLWRLVFSIHTPDILERWLNFLEKHPNIRGVPKDTWNMFLNFAETCDITSYDDTEAWPSLFDDFVEYETDRTNQNLKDDEINCSGSGGNDGNIMAAGAPSPHSDARL